MTYIGRSTIKCVQRRAWAFALQLSIFGLTMSAVLSCSLDGGAAKSIPTVYVAGYEDTGTTITKYWKNGTPVELTDGSQGAVAIFLM
jgi:hypothetical protein